MRSFREIIIDICTSYTGGIALIITGWFVGTISVSVATETTLLGFSVYHMGWWRDYWLVGPLGFLVMIVQFTYLLWRNWHLRVVFISSAICASLLIFWGATRYPLGEPVLTGIWGGFVFGAYGIGLFQFIGIAIAGFVTIVRIFLKGIGNK